jgi:hypothetical protein
MAELEGQLLEEIARCARMSLMVVAEFKVRRTPSKEPSALLPIRALELAPARKALLVAVGTACGKINGVDILLCSSTNGRAAA